jgi:3-dehydroshikimate dehydratase
MIKPGLVSITFRQLSIAEIVALVKQSGLKGIEWGGDVHVPHGDMAAAKLAKQQTVEAGLTACSYGSYYRAGVLDEVGVPYQAVLDTALELGAPVVRVWAGTKGTDDADAEYRTAVITDLQRIGELSADAGIHVACEYHGWSLTDSTEAALALMTEVNHPNVGMYWQPKPERGLDYSLEAITSLAPHLANIHVFNWSPEGRKLPLSEGSADWARYFEAVNALGLDHWGLLEFVCDNDPDNFLADAATLLKLLTVAP